MKPTTPRSKFGMAVSGILLGGQLVLVATLARGATWACDADDLYTKLTGCPSSASTCVIAEDVVCDTVNCSANCTYDLGTAKTLLVEGTVGKLSGINSRGITVKAKKVTTDSDTSKTRYSGSSVTIDTRAATHATTDGLDVDLTGNVTASAVLIYGGKIKVRNIDSLGGSTVILADATDDAEGTLEVAGTVDASSDQSHGGVIWLHASRTVLVSSNGSGNSILARTNGCSGFCEAGEVLLTTGAPYNYSGDRPTITINRPVSANSTTGSSAGGSVFIGRTPYYFVDPAYPSITLAAAAHVNTDAKGSAYAGGTVTIEGWDVSVSSNVDANATGTAQGGQITVVAHDPSVSADVLVVDNLTARGGTGGDVELRADGDVRVTGRVNLTARDAAPRTGGTFKLLPRTTADCQQEVKLDDDVDTHGYGSSGQGGTIEIEGASVYMAPLTHRELNADRQGSPPSSGSGGGTIYLRAASDSPGVVLYYGSDPSSNPHTITALPGGTIQTSANPHGGTFSPARGTDLGYLSCNNN